LLQLSEHVILVGFVFRLLHVARAPVADGIIRTEYNALLPAFVGQFLDDIPGKRSRIHDVIVGRGSVERAKAIVMFGGDNHVFLTGFFDQADPLLRVEVRGIEPARHFLPILIRWYHRMPVTQTDDLYRGIIRAFALPVAPEFRVSAKVDESAELRVTKPLPTLIGKAAPGIPG